jgi:hypothetical protein
MAKYKLIKEGFYNEDVYVYGEVYDENYRHGKHSNSVAYNVNIFPENWELVKEFKVGDRIKVLYGLYRYDFGVVSDLSTPNFVFITLDCGDVLHMRNDYLELVKFQVGDDVEIIGGVCKGKKTYITDIGGKTCHVALGGGQIEVKIEHLIPIPPFIPKVSEPAIRELFFPRVMRVWNAEDKSDVCAMEIHGHIETLLTPWIDGHAEGYRYAEEITHTNITMAMALDICAERLGTIPEFLTINT